MRARPVFAALLACALAAHAQTRRALLIGINTYQPAGTSAQHPVGCAYGRCELGAFQNLAGAVNDASAMADLLTSPKFGFPAANVALLTNPAPAHSRPGVAILPTAQTDRGGILAAMQRYLVDLPAAGDVVVFYDASHGSLRVNSKGTKLTIFANGAYLHADSTLVPADAYKGGFDIRDREMTRIFQAALDKGVRLTILFDSCHSGAVTRGGSGEYLARTLAYDPRDIAEPPDLKPDGTPQTPPTEREDNPALVFSAAQQDQEADEAVPTPERPEAHGAFTAALIQALEALPADAPAALVYQRVKAVLESDSFTHQEPELDANALRRSQPLFGADTAPAGSRALRAAALSTDAAGKVWLDVGRVSGIGAGSEFTALESHAGPAAEAIRLRVDSLEGIARSSATILGPAGAKVTPGQIFRLTRWVPAASAPLRLWHWPANLPPEAIAAAAAQIRLAGFTLVADPADEPWTDMLFWDGDHWILRHADANSAAIHLDAQPAPIALGSTLTAAALTQHLAPGALLWANLPPARELAARLTQGTGAIESAPSLAEATYLLAGALSDSGIAYAWFNKSEFDAGPPRAGPANHSSGCSATSQYPVRSNWIALTPAQPLSAADALNRGAALLAKVHGWLQLANNPVGAASGNYYRLAMLHAEDHTALAVAQPAQQDDRLELALVSDQPVTERRWVYVLDIDCHGQGTLLYPRDLTENQFPSGADSASSFILPGSPTLRIGPPFGIDTLILLSTAQPLPDPYALEFDAVVKRGAGAQSPLEQLLTDASHATRGAPQPVPTDWGLGLLTLHSIPKAASP